MDPDEEVTYVHYSYYVEHVAWLDSVIRCAAFSGLVLTREELTVGLVFVDDYGKPVRIDNGTST